jgi:SAM-dependent methyltransferase
MQDARSYTGPPPRGRDRFIVAALSAWLPDAVTTAIRSAAAPVQVLDVRCGDQPLRATIEAAGATYFSLDVTQNTAGSVDSIAAIDADDFDACPRGVRSFDVIVCTEVLEHVADWPTAFRNIRRLCAPAATVIITVPFVFPLHMEPVDFFRATPYALRMLAGRFGFAVAVEARLGHPLDLIRTLLADLSVLPARRTTWHRAQAFVARGIRAALIGLLSPSRLQGLTINSNAYLSNAFVLKASGEVDLWIGVPRAGS